ncbi:hypothetical protein Cflav_PD6121 [Pedosphaera parvula Ellin514]|uniref:Uncharacterized protein n=2 Tax=Pedosphaera TaxID=1032526 RepID=B9XP22_PEDPL|nr:hypothetical protein Cflav_PD6121 [Pedosphaera parvula Ellin514]
MKPNSSQIMKQYTLKWPDDFEDYAWQIESKGWFVGLEIIIDGKTLKPIFYDPARLSQDILEEISSAGFFVESFLIVIQQVTRETIERAIADLARTGGLERLV